MPRSGSSNLTIWMHQANNNHLLGEYFNHYTVPVVLPTRLTHVKAAIVSDEKAEKEGFSLDTFDCFANFNNKVDLIDDPKDYTIKILGNHLYQTESFRLKFAQCKFVILERKRILDMLLSWAYANATDYQYLHNHPSYPGHIPTQFELSYLDFQIWRSVYKKYQINRNWIEENFVHQHIVYEDIDYAALQQEWNITTPQSKYKRMNIDYAAYAINLTQIKDWILHDLD